MEVTKRWTDGKAHGRKEGRREGRTSFRPSVRPSFRSSVLSRPSSLPSFCPSVHPSLPLSSLVSACLLSCVFFRVLTYSIPFFLSIPPPSFPLIGSFPPSLHFPPFLHAFHHVALPFVLSNLSIPFYPPSAQFLHFPSVLQISSRRWKG